jgi:hypothetical protein
VQTPRHFPQHFISDRVPKPVVDITAMQLRSLRERMISCDISSTITPRFHKEMSRS